MHWNFKRRVGLPPNPNPKDCPARKEDNSNEKGRGGSAPRARGRFPAPCAKKAGPASLASLGDPRGGGGETERLRRRRRR
eukprot:9481872-Pyramimonas_sp.AAC.1